MALPLHVSEETELCPHDSAGPSSWVRSHGRLGFSSDGSVRCLLPCLPLRGAGCFSRRPGGALMSGLWKHPPQSSP